jgi:ACS family hexuronate transporter-like MFS transporter
MRAMLLIAFFPLVVLLAQPFGYISFWVPVILIGIGASAHQAWSANIFTTVSDMFPKKAVGSVTGIGGMFGGFGGIVVSQSAGWLFDAYRHAGIALSWTQAKAGALGDYLNQILALNLVNKHGSVINLNVDELGNLPKEVIAQLQAINPTAFEQLKQMQTTIVQGQMKTAYSIMFAICAVSYLIAWVVMKTLVPKYKKIENL